METNITDRLTEFFRTYYAEEIAQLAQHYPQEKRSLNIDYRDIVRFDPDIGDDLIDHPDKMVQYFEEALSLYDLPVAVDLSGAHVRVYNLPQAIDISEVSRHRNTGRLLAAADEIDEHGEFSRWPCVREFDSWSNALGKAGITT